MFPAGAAPELVDRVADDMSNAPPEVALSALEHARRNGPAVVAVNAGHEPTDAESLRRHGVKAFVLPGPVHFLMMEAPDAFNGLLAEAIEYIRPLWTYS
jgi:pimeloyl-ACP methyl ester carboxylesterase